MKTRLAQLVLLGAATAPASSRASSCSDSCLGPGTSSRQIGNPGGTIPWPFQIYKSVPYTPPQPQIKANGEPLAPGLIFVTVSNFNTNNDYTKQASPVIYTLDGELVWNGPVLIANNLNKQVYQGKDVLTYWTEQSSTGAANVGHGYGNVTILDSAYNVITVICPDLGLHTFPRTPGPCQADLHESIITPDGTIIVSAYNATRTDMRSIGGPKDGWVFDSQFYEIDIATHKVVYSWKSLDHVPLSESHLPLREGNGTTIANAYDFFHINSVEKVGQTYLVNGRHTWSTYLVDNLKGDVIWRIEGKTGGDFGTLPAQGHFAWQHFARVHNQTSSSVTLSWFNNFAGPARPFKPSSGLTLELSLPPNKSKPPKLVRHLVANPPLIAGSQGSYQILGAASSGNQIVDYGQLAIVKEFGPEAVGNPIRWTAQFGLSNEVQIYRGYKYEWHATPTTPPALVVLGGASSKCRKAYVSWNGATEVTGYAVYEGDAAGSLCKVGEVAKKGFETEFGVGRRCVQIAAIKGGKEVKRSNVVC